MGAAPAERRMSALLKAASARMCVLDAEVTMSLVEGSVKAYGAAYGAAYGWAELGAR